MRFCQNGVLSTSGLFTHKLSVLLKQKELSPLILLGESHGYLRASDSVVAGGKNVDQLSEASEAGEVDSVNTALTKRTDPWRKWLWVFLGAVVFLQIYYVQEMLAALAVFVALFAIGAVVMAIVYALGRAGEATISLAEPMAKRGLIIAEEFSKKASRRPRSAPVP